MEVTYSDALKRGKELAQSTKHATFLDALKRWGKNQTQIKKKYKFSGCTKR